MPRNAIETAPHGTISTRNKAAAPSPIPIRVALFHVGSSSQRSEARSDSATKATKGVSL